MENPQNTEVREATGPNPAPSPTSRVASVKSSALPGSLSPHLPVENAHPTCHHGHGTNGSGAEGLDTRRAFQETAEESGHLTPTHARSSERPGHTPSPPG